MKEYKILENNEDPNCLKVKYIRPGEEIHKLLRDTILDFLKTTDNYFNGGWSIHNALKKIDKKLALYDENDICETTDFDLFGYRPVQDLIKLANILSNKITKSDMTFSVDPGMHPNQYTLKINFMNIKMIDLIFISKNVSNFLEKSKHDNLLYLDAKVELLRQYNMITNIFLLAPDKKIDKVIERINKLEKYILIPHLENIKLWDMRRNNLITEVSFDKDHVLISNEIKICVKQSDYICSVGYLVYNKIFKLDTKSNNATITESHLSTKYKYEYVIHDAVFNKEIDKIIYHLKKELNKDLQNRIEFCFHDAFIGVIGPLYNGWCEISVDNKCMFTFYSLATPVHVYQNKMCSYFFNMTHCMWRELYFRYKNELTEAEFYTKLYSRFLKHASKNDNARFFLYKVTSDNFIGKYPARNVYQASNILRTKKQNYFKYTTDPKYKNHQAAIEDFFYRNFEGKILFNKTLNKIYKSFNLNYLYRRGETQEPKKHDEEEVIKKPIGFE